MIPDNNCESYPNCELCNNGGVCWRTGARCTPNLILNREIDFYNNIYQVAPISYPDNDFQLNKSVAHLISWEVDYRKQHHKEINITNIIDWYNKKFYSSITAKELELFFNNQIK